MKINRKQLRRMINETLTNEGVFDWMKDKATDVWNVGTRLKSGKGYTDIIKNSSQDAHDMFMAMKGLGTDESQIRRILLKRSKSNDLTGLYQEFGDMLKFLSRLDFDKITAYAFGPGIMNSLTDNGDLIDWLIGDGMDEEAMMISDELEKEGVEREMVDV